MQGASPGTRAAASYEIAYWSPQDARKPAEHLVHRRRRLRLSRPRLHRQTDYRTPALDRLAAESIRFTQAYANSALCTNTRVALIIGRYQYRLPIGLVEPLRWSGRQAPEVGLPAGFPTLPSLLRGTGYRTVLIGKCHLGYLPRYSPLKSGYDEFFGVMGGALKAEVTRQAAMVSYNDDFRADDDGRHRRLASIVADTAFPPGAGYSLG